MWCPKDYQYFRLSNEIQVTHLVTNTLNQKQIVTSAFKHRRSFKLTNSSNWLIQTNSSSLFYLETYTYFDLNDISYVE